MKKIKLFCFPYAGGSAAIYSRWRSQLDNRIELVPVELAGRGKRIKENFYENIPDAIEDIYGKIVPLAKEYEFAFFGHSMGSVIVYELCKRMIDHGLRQPIHVFVSGRYPPHIKKREKLLHMLPLNEFKDEILEIGGTPREVFENEELSQIFVPIMKADYKLVETYKYVENNIKLDCGLTVFNGKFDKGVDLKDVYEWKKYTSCDSKFYEFEGGHFFIHNYTDEIVRIINETLACSFIKHYSFAN
ncbi:MAG: thioesterase domain-containing protein [Clostridia bacterium]|nr:thioesterase domain-containing protein [Clostridia bacterium]